MTTHKLQTAYLILFVLGCSFNSMAQRTIQIKLKTDSQFELPGYKKEAEDAVTIANAVFSSAVFQQKIAAIDFKHSSYCKGRTSCTKNEKDNEVRIPGNLVLNDLFAQLVVEMTLNVEKSGNALGKTCPGENDITMFYENIMYDMRDDKMPASYKLAVNLCHEYMHQVGFCHIYGKLNESNGKPDTRYINEDVTYRIGWEAYYILVDWYAHKVAIKGL